jgi:hypothetical protein
MALSQEKVDKLKKTRSYSRDPDQLLARKRAYLS